MTQIYTLGEFEDDGYYLVRRENQETIYRVHSIHLMRQYITLWKLNKEVAVRVQNRTFDEFEIFHISQEEEPEYFL